MAAVSESVESPHHSGSGVPPSATGPTILRRLSRGTIVGAGIGWMALASLVALMQQPSTDPVEPATASFEWWLRPLERNPLLRLEATGSLVRARVQPESGAVFVTGAGGLIMRSTDAGRTWHQTPVGWLQSPIAVPAGAAATTSSNALLDEVQLASQSAPGAPQNLRVISGEQKGPAPYEQRAIEEPTKDGSSNALQAESDPVEPAPPPVAFGTIVDIAFAGQRAWAVGTYGTVLRSADGGATWQQEDAGTNDTFYSITPTPDGATLCAAAAGEGVRVFRSEDGGRTWRGVRLPVEGNDAISVVARADGEMWVSTRTALLASTDACRSWKVRLPIEAAEFGEMQFSRDGRRGWVAATNTVYRTVDSGRTWRAGPALEGQLVLLHFADDRRGFVSSEDGVVYETNDGGDTWTPHSLGAEAVASIVLAGDTIVGASETLGLLTSEDGGASWRTRSAPAMTHAHFHVDGRRGWAVGERGALLATTDGGESWSPVASGVGTALRDVHFLGDGQRGWAVGDEGVVITTTDGGTTWTRRRIASETGALWRVWFDADGGRGSVIAPSAAFTTLDGGNSWAEVDLGAFLTSPEATTRLPDGWLLAAGGAMLRFRDNGSVERLAFTGPEPTALVWHPGGEVWAVGANGFAAVSGDEGTTWTRRNVGTNDDLDLVSFLSQGARGWIGGNEGLRTTFDGGSTWRTQGGLGAPASRRIVPIPRGGALALARNGTMHRTADGTGWVPLEHATYPAPWYYVAVLLGLALVTLVVSNVPEVNVAERASVADVFVSDRPLERGDPDALALDRVATGLARFLANEKTDPPLTIAITGEWGSGKTSLMNLSREVLRDFGFRTVWFNAWHHQTEEHLLGALIESLRRDAIEPWWSPRGFAVRIRLLVFRGMRHWVPAAGSLLTFCAAAGYLLQDPSNRFRDAVAWIGGLFGQGGAGVTTGNAVDLLSILGTAGGLVPLLKGMQAFGTSQKQLSATLSAYDPLRELKLPTGFRHRFADTFRDITRALEPQTLVLFIDDLDRCRPANVVATLEMVNFLVTSGRCIVVIGMARDRVERCVGLGFADVAALDDADADPDEAKRTATRRLERFARQYLEKLINIEIPVPRATPDQSKRLLASAFYRSDRYRPRWDASSKKWLQSAAAALAVVILAIAGYSGGRWVHRASAPQEVREEQQNAEQSTQERQAPPAAASAASPPRGVQRVEPTEPAAAPDDPLREAVLVPSVTHSPWWPPVAVAFAIGLLAVVPRLSHPRVHVEHDSPTFTRALDQWFPLVFQKTPTPRAIKRFLNRVRFYAMSEREAPAAGDARDRIPEEALVALSVLQHIGAEHQPALPPTTAPELSAAWQRALPYRDEFRRMAEGVSM